MTRYLRELGYEVTVLASNLWGGLPDDETERVTRVRDLRTLPVVRPLLERSDLPVPGYVPERTPPAVLTHVIVPEPKVVTWLPPVVRAARRLLRTETVDCLVTSSPPESGHLLGLALGKRRPPWVADFRDGWTFEPVREQFPTAVQRSFDSWLERRVAQAAEVVVGATAPLARDLESRYGANALHVPNGWDPRETTNQGALPPHDPTPGEVRLVYTGRMSGRGRGPASLVQALRTVNASSTGTTVRLVHAGELTEDERRLVSNGEVAPFYEYLGIVDRGAAIELQRSADALVLLTSRDTSEATGKLYEYLASGRPIVALAEGNEAERVVRETNTGITVPPDDVDAIADAFRRVASGELAAIYSPRDVERYRYPRPAEQMAEAIEEAIARGTRLRR
jgi:glycosyltransferase involved in cell wall biosynthesis